MEVIDVVLGRDEIDIMNFRVEYLSGVVNKTYVGESKSTHSYQPKKLHFAEAYESEAARATQWEPIEIPEPNDDMEASDSWAFEKHSRDWLVGEVLARHPGAVILLCDIDEVPSRDQVLRGIEWVKRHKVGSLPMKFAYRRANWIFRPSVNQWTKAKMFTADSYIPSLRLKSMPWIPGNPGIHLSFVGLGNEEIANKLSSYAHTEYSGEGFSAPEFLNFCDKFAIDHLGRAFSWGGGVFCHEGPDKFGEVQRKAVEMYPHWFATDPPRQSMEKRIGASLYAWLIHKTSLGKSLSIAHYESPRVQRLLVLLMPAYFFVAGLNGLRRLKTFIRFG